ncbi:MAG: Gfo/Idh/MocA family oxidoreductase [Ignavibacteria bacterium]|nr:Gfo/Idh/MocA family oxidoreductase [Ignavibacteria bacterium]
MKTEKIRIGQAGIANHGRTIVNAVRDAGNLQLASCFDINESANRAVAKEFDARAAASYEELVQDSSIDAVVLVTPNHLHADQVQMAIAAGKHIFVEKPITNTVSEAKRSIAFAGKAGLTLMVGHNTRRRRVFRRAKQLLSERRIGTVVGVEANLSRPAGIQADLPAWKADPTKCALLPMMQLGIHFVDTVTYLLGPIARVSCFAANVAMPGNVLDSTSALLQLESGIPVALSSYYVSADAYFVRIYGTEGTIHCTPLKLRLELLQNGELREVQEEDFSSEGAESFVLQMREFGECILRGMKPETGGDEGLMALAVIEAMLRSVQTNSVVELRDILHD